jgi:hypothetical protein
MFCTAPEANPRSVNECHSAAKKDRSISRIARTAGPCRSDAVACEARSCAARKLQKPLAARHSCCHFAPYEALRAWLAGLWRAGETAWTPEARRIFTELSIDGEGGKRQLLESPTFRELLEHGAPLSLPQAA